MLNYLKFLKQLFLIDAKQDTGHPERLGIFPYDIPDQIILYRMTL
jgi:hypothetical protein